MSVVLASNLSKPLKIMSKFTERVRKGDLKSKLKLKSYTKEVSQLSDSISYLVDTLDDQDMLRKKLTSRDKNTTYDPAKHNGGLSRWHLGTN